MQRLDVTCARSLPRGTQVNPLAAQAHLTMVENLNCRGVPACVPGSAYQKYKRGKPKHLTNTNLLGSDRNLNLPDKRHHSRLNYY